MQIWVDADACPGVIEEILYADRQSFANQLDRFIASRRKAG